MPKVCIDVGHVKGYNPSPALPQYSEGTRMWKLGEYLVSELKERGVTVVQTRSSSSKDLALLSRGQKSKGCDLFLSLHSNAAGSKMNENIDYPVACVHRSDSKTTIDERAQDIGLKLATVVQKTMSTTQKARTSTRASSSDRDKNGLLDDEYYGVLQGAKNVNVPGVILEHSFHTNTKMTQWLLSDTNLKKLAAAEAACISEWLGIENDFPYTVRVTISDLNIRSGPGVNYSSKGYIKPGVYTITDEKNGFGKLKSGAGWISLMYCARL